MTTHDWLTILTNSLWLLGLALLLAVGSFRSYSCRLSRLLAREIWRNLISSGWARVGAYLFFAGMVLSAGSILEAMLWGVLGIAVGYEWRRVGKNTTLVTDDGREFASLSTDDGYGTALRRVASWLVRTELLWLLLLSPFFLAPLPGRVWALLVLPLLWIARRISTGHFISRTPLDWALLLLLVMVLVSLFATTDINVSLDHVMALLLGVGLYYALAAQRGNGAASPRGAEWAVWAYALVGGALAIAALLGTAWGNKLPGLAQVTGALPSVLRRLLGDNANGFNPNIVGGALLLFVPLQVALAGWSWVNYEASPGGRWLRRVGLSLLAIISMGTLILTQSRAALTSVFVGLFLLAWTVSRRVGLVITGALLAAALAVIVAIGPQQVTDKLLGQSGTDLSAGNSIQSLQGRTELWSRALYGIEDFPLTGMGMGTFGRVLPIMYPSFLVSPDMQIGHAHNQFLQAGLDLGLPGLVAYLAIWFLAAALATMAWKQARDRWSKAIASGIAACLLASFIFGMIDAVVLVSRPGVFFWALVGLLVSQVPTATSDLTAGAQSTQGLYGDHERMELTSKTLPANG
jgi:putative inorganic carbon (HCO3(-)) transporter